MRARPAPTLAPGLALLAVFGLGGGCHGATRAQICQQICDCRGCSKVEAERCEAEVDKAEKIAGDQRCDDAWDSVASCVVDKLGCMDDEIDGSACASEISALQTCATVIPITTPFGGACSAFLAKVRACCKSLDDPATQDVCLASIEQTGPNIPEEACQAALDVFQCSFQ